MLTVNKPKKNEYTDNIVKEELVIWDDTEMQKLSEVAAIPFQNGVDGYKHRLAIIFVMWSFLRIGEAIALQWKDIDFNEETVNVYKQFSRVKNRDSVYGGYKRILYRKNSYSEVFAHSWIERVCEQKDLLTNFHRLK